MDADERFLSIFSAFFAGRLAYPRLVKELEAAIGAAPGGADGFLDTLDELTNLGRLPPDLAAALRPLANVEAAVEEAPAPEPADQHDDAPTVPLNIPYPPRPEPAAAPAAPAALGAREMLDDGVLSALTGDYRRFRDRPRGGQAQRPYDDGQLDALIGSYRGARMRRDAARATAGEARAFDLAGAHGTAGKRAGIGTLLKDRFVLDRELGRGGMGVVYAAVDRRRLEAMHTQPYVAVKLLNDDLQKHPDALRTLEGEARKAQALAHPNIVTVYDFDRDGGHVFLVMELLEGRGLDQVLKERNGGAMTPDAAAPIIAGVCAALGHAHAQGVIHADLKPANVFLPEGGGVKLLDFGISTAGRVAGFDATALGALTGAYASPEMLDGAPRDPRDDVFALGCLIHLMLTGSHPFDRKPANQAREAGLAPTPIAALPRRARSTVLAMLAFDRARRPADLEEIRKGLLEESRWSRLMRWRRRPAPDPVLDGL